MGLADADALDALAAQLDDKAEEVRERCRSFRGRVEGVAWQSTGAEHYREQCRQLWDRLEANAQELNDAADDLRRHAQGVRDTLSWIGDKVDDLRRAAEDAWDDTKGAFNWGKDKAEGAVDKVLGWL